MRLMAAVTVTIAALAAGPASWAASPVQDFRALCVNTHADPADAYKAADALGWIRATGEMARTLAPLAGNPESRVTGSGGPGFRALTASVGKAPKPTPPLPMPAKPTAICVLTARGDPAAAAKDLEAALGTPPTRKMDVLAACGASCRSTGS